MRPARRRSRASAASSSDQSVRESDSGAECSQDGAAFAVYDETLLDVCRTRWQFGDWPRLAAIAPETLLHHPDRARIALLVSSALFQIGEQHQALRVLQLALDWGASHKQAAQMLVSGTHQSLAEAHSLIDHPESAREHFREAIHTGGVPGDPELLAQARLLHSNHSAS